MDRVARWVRELSPLRFGLLVTGLGVLWLALTVIALFRLHYLGGN